MFLAVECLAISRATVPSPRNRPASVSTVARWGKCKFGSIKLCFSNFTQRHNKADCTNPQIDRPFTGICRICDKEGHRAADCPDKPAEICRTCGQEGHKRAECKAARKDVFMNVQEISSEDAWNALKAADKERDIDDAKKVGHSRLAHYKSS